MWVIYKKKFNLVSFIGILFSVLAALLYVFKGKDAYNATWMVAFLGIIVAGTQGCFAAITDSEKWKNVHPGVLSLIGALVTTICAFFYALFNGELNMIINITVLPLLSLIAVGILSNGIGFSLFLIAIQKTSGIEAAKKKQKVWLLSSLAIIPFVQMLFLLAPIQSIKDKINIPKTSWGALIFLVISFLILRISDWYENRKAKPETTIKP